MYVCMYIRMYVWILCVYYTTVSALATGSHFSRLHVTDVTFSAKRRVCMTHCHDTCRRLEDHVVIFT